MFARELLRLPSFAIAGICVAAMLLSQLANAGYAAAMTMCSIVWGLVLYSVAQEVLNEKSGLGRVTFPIAMLLVAATISLPQLAEAIRGDLLYFVAPAGVVLAAVSVAFAVSALLRTEGKSGWVFTFPSALVVLAILFLPLGIWFVRPRIEDLLQRASP